MALRRHSERYRKQKFTPGHRRRATGAEHMRKPPPIWILVPKGEGGLDKDSYVLCNQIRTVDEARLGDIYGQLSAKTMKEVDDALRISLSL